MDRVRRLIAVVFIAYALLVTGACIWLGVFVFSASSKQAEVELSLKQVIGEKELMEKRLKDDNLRLAEQIGSFQKDRDTAKAESQNSSARMDRFTVEHDAVKKELESVKSELNKARADKMNLEVKIQSNVDPLIQQARDEARVSFEKERLKLNRELADVRELFQKTQSERDNMNIELQRLKSENSSLSSERASLGKKVDIYDRQLRSESQDKSKLSSELKDLRESHAAYSKENSVLLAANTKLQRQIKDAVNETSSLKAMLSDSKEQAARLNKEKDTVDIQLKLEKSEKSKYYDEARKYRELSDKLVKDVAAEKESARKLSDELKAEKTENSKKTNELTKSAEDLKSRNTALMESFRKAELEREDNLIKWKAASDKTVILEKDISRLEDARKSLEAKYDSRDKELQKVEAEAQKLKKDILSLDREYAAVSETLLAAKMSETVMKDQLANSQKLLREAEARLRSETGKYEEQMSSLGTQNNLLQDALTKAKSDLQLLTNSLKIEQAEKYKYYEESKLQSARNNELQRQTEAVHLKVRAADEENQLLAGRLKDVQSQTDTLRKENTNLKAQVLSSDALVTQLKEQMESGVKRSSEREASFSSRIAELTGLLKERTGEKEKIQAEKNKADESYVKLDKEYQAVVESAKISTGDLSALKQVNADLQSKLAKSEGLKGKAEKDLIEVSEALKVSRESERKIHEQLTGAQKSYAETEARLKGQLAKNEEQIIVLGNTAKKLSVERVSQDKQIKEMSEQLDVLAAENKNQKNQLGGNVSQIAGLNDMVRKLSSEKESQDRQLRDLNEQLVLLTKENKSQKEQLSKSEKDIRARTDELASLQKGLNEEMAKSKEDKVKYDDARVRYEEQINKLKSDGTALEGANKKLFQQVETQGKQLRDKDESLMTLSRDSRDYKERVGSLEQQLSKIEGESRVKITELSDKLRSETSRHDDTASRLRFASDKVSSLEKDIKRYEETNKSLMAKYDAIDKDFRASEIERQKVSTDLKSANDRIGLLQKDQGYLDSSLKAAVSERDKAQEDKNKNEMNLAGVTKEANLLREKNDQLLKDSAALQSKIKTQEYEFNTALKKERDAYLVAFNELNSAKEAARGSQWQLSELQTKNVTLDKTVASLQTQLKSQESDMQATIKQERDMRNSYMAKLEEAEGRVNNYMKVEIDLRQKNSTIEKELAAWKVTVDDKIAEAMKQKETDYINRLREANERVKIMEETLTKERSNFYYNLASYATRSQLFEEALNYYAKSLLQNPKDAATYYNMGVLYDEHLDNPSKAIFSYSKYLELAPADAADREKVKKWINSLEKRLGGSKSGLIKKD